MARRFSLGQRVAAGRLAWWLAGGLLVASIAWPALVYGQRSSQPDYGEPIRTINELIRRTWQDYGLRPSGPATDGEWCRRVFLDVLGRVPTVNELQEFTRDRSPDKKLRLVNKLLHDDRYTEEYARNWTTIWTNILIGRTGGTERNSLTNREGMQKYLRDSFAANKPYDRMVYELVTATGSTAPGTPNFNGATNFLADKVNQDNATLATAATARIFLGLQVQCTQCHNHPFNDWKQQKFWEFNAFFRQTRALRRTAPASETPPGLGTPSAGGVPAPSRQTAQYAELVDEDFPGENNDPSSAAIFYELRNATTSVAYPVFIDGTKIPESGYVSQVNRRKELARLMLQSEYLDKAIVNRYWGHFLGYGFTKPVDDLGPHNPPSHPELLDFLARQFREHSYDLKELIRWIVLSEPYGLSSRVTSGNESDDPLLGEPPKFSRFYVRQMQAEQLYESLITATQAGRQGSYEEQERRKNEWLRQFVTAFGNDEGEEATMFNGSIPQVLMMMNGELIRQALSLQPGSFLHQVVTSNDPPAKKINYLFQAGLARNATRTEIDIANKLLLARQGKVEEALQDIWWAILNSNEFILIH
ncbi:MAG: hypothetical protein KatS3mg110_1514 [Pirellulaceae bacterium]|nr:MAG: hypothetical protein KatS3mg110_1514 [Pirellulaceae bacterium]